ncbi:substrate-binding domain-containing protein [Salinisphaera sp. LB1]|uniref:LacI family DNA-binding transcriptional regulator n=1 Tax=Salinisphaera sp. LB1 TaxID=2183911 RepID=UPI000D7076EC|nr:substrate-binding domain-containing protein [Salinisphaera sp. LB1]AWN14899.1 2-ketogluconate utilization repressor PtxS [Salinisphaera sp. LB1]
MSDSRPQAQDSTRRPTIRDVARDAGISKTSVSRFFGDERHRLSEAMQARIEQSVERLGFRPDRIAASLRGGRTRLIGALVADIRNPYSVALIHAAERACGEAGYSLMVCNTDNDETLERRHLEVLDGYSVDGLIVNTVGRNTEALEAMRERRLPMVLVDRQIDALDCDMVGLDDVAAVDEAIAHLVARGYERLELIIEPVAGISSRIARAEAFEAECRRRGLAADRHEAVIEQAGAPGLDERLAELMAEPRPTAVLCANGVVTLAVCHALQRLNGFHRLGVLGIDELAWCALAGPGISTLAQPVDAIGRRAIGTLLARINGDTAPAAVHRLPATLQARGSTAPPA